MDDQITFIPTTIITIFIFVRIDFSAKVRRNCWKQEPSAQGCAFAHLLLEPEGKLRAHFFWFLSELLTQFWTSCTAPESYMLHVEE